MGKRVTVTIETGFSENYLCDGVEGVFTDKELEKLAIDEFIMDLDKAYEEKDLKRYIQVSVK
jgi:hypothetical protein